MMQRSLTVHTYVHGWRAGTGAWGKHSLKLGCVWNVIAHAQKPDFVFRRNGRVHLNRWGRQLSRLLAAEVCTSAVVMLDTPCSEVVRRILATHYIRQFPLHFPSRASPCATTFHLDATDSAQKDTRRFEDCLYFHLQGLVTLNKHWNRRGVTLGFSINRLLVQSHPFLSSSRRHIINSDTFVKRRFRSLVTWRSIM